MPAVDTLLMLRPTDSPTLFLQQLGRGLRTSTGKTVCTVLDFVGHHRKEFRFDRRFRALLGGSRKRRRASRSSRASRSCRPAATWSSTAVAREIVLDSIREAIPSRWPREGRGAARAAREAADVTLAAFLDETGLELEDVYAGDDSPGRTCARPPASPSQPPGRTKTSLRRACGRLLHVDDVDANRRLPATCSQSTTPPDRQRCPSVERAAAADARRADCRQRARPSRRRLQEACDLLWAHPQVRAELLELLDVLADARRPRRIRPARRIRTSRCRSTLATRASRSSPRSAIGDARQGRTVADGRLLGEEAQAPTCSRSRSTRPAASSRRRRATATTRSAAS